MKNLMNYFMEPERWILTLEMSIFLKIFFFAEKINIFQNPCGTEINTFSLQNNDFTNVSRAARWQIWQQLISALFGLFYILARSNEKLGSNSSQHCLDFSTFWCQAMKNVEAPDLSIVYTFLILCTKKLLSLIKRLIEKPGSKAVPLRCAATNLRAVHLSIV